MDRVAVIGSTGQLGHDLAEVLRAANHFEVVALDHGQIECADAESVRRRCCLSRRGR